MTIRQDLERILTRLRTIKAFADGESVLSKDSRHSNAADRAIAAVEIAISEINVLETPKQTDAVFQSHQGTRSILVGDSFFQAKFSQKI